MEDELKIQTRYQKIDEIIATINGSERRKTMITEIELDDYMPKKEAFKMLSDVQEEINNLQTYKLFSGDTELYLSKDDVKAILDKRISELEVEDGNNKRRSN